MSADVAADFPARLTQFLKRRMPDVGAVEVTDCRPITGGYSCISTRFVAVIDGEPRTFLARADKPADQQVLATSDRRLEWELLSALTASGNVPMPDALFCDEDGSELGATTIILDYKKNGSFLNRLRALDASDLPREADAFVDLAADIHSASLDSIPPSVARPPDWSDYVDEMIEVWRRVEAQQIGTHPIFRYMAMWLEENRPPPAPMTLVHGEFQPGNAVLDDDGALLAIDWEFAHIGDPREDLGWALWVGAVQPPDLVTLDFERFCARYREHTGLGADVVNPMTVSYFTILPSLRVVGGALEQQRSFIEGTNTSIQTAYMGGGIVTAQEQWLLAARNIQAAALAATEGR